MHTKEKITPFQQSVYDACKRIPKGRVSTYAFLGNKIILIVILLNTLSANAIGNRKACRAVGTALRKNPFAPIVPCHRVVASDLTLGGFSGSKENCELKRKYDLLCSEGVEFESDLPIDLLKQSFSIKNSKLRVKRIFLQTD
jgi:methylated-DNA-[protein]-cysteine S-methyltransferase